MHPDLPPQNDNETHLFSHKALAGPRLRSCCPPFARSALVLALSLGAHAAPTDAPGSAGQGELKTLAPVVVRESREAPQGKDTLRATTSSIGKGQQELRDVPQSVTVVTEKLIDDRNLDTLKEALRNTAGVTFLAAEGGEEDIRLRGFSLAATGDIFVDGLRDPAFYDRDTSNFDRIELLRGSASMLFGRGSTGGVVNQVSKQPHLGDEHELALTLGSYNYRRVVADLNAQTGDTSALRLNAMHTEADNNGSGSAIDKYGIAPSFAWGLGTADEFVASLYALYNRNGMNYGLPYVRASASAPVADTGLLTGLDPDAYYGAASDYNDGSAETLTFSHRHRFADASELKTVARHGRYERDQRASTIRFVNPTFGDTLNAATPLRRGSNNKIQDLESTTLQSDYSGKFNALGVRHALLAGLDLAREDFRNYNTTLPAGLTLTKPNTTLGSPDDGGGVDESRRILSVGRSFEARASGAYVQDLIQITPLWKLLAGLRFDRFSGDFESAAVTNAAGVVTTPAARRSRSDSLWSRRFGLLYQPSLKSSYHFSYGTSFNTSGDTYQYDNQTANTPPESSENLELGAKLDSEDGQFTTRMALFRSTKKNERNRDPDSAAVANLLSGKRHSAGFELDITGRITHQWEVYGSYAWTPIARIDVGAPGSVPGVAEGAGTRASLTPRHSGTVWSTYQWTPSFRFGGGVNFRGSQTPNRNPGFAAPSFVTADLMAEYAFDLPVFEQRYFLKANLNNLSDKLYAESLYTGHYIPGSGRNLQVTLSTRF